MVPLIYLFLSPQTNLTNDIPCCTVVSNKYWCFRRGNSAASSTRNSRNFPVLFASDDEENNPFLSPTSNCSIQIKSNSVRITHKAKVIELHFIGCYYLWFDNRRCQGLASDHQFSISTLMRMAEVIIRNSNLFWSHSFTLITTLSSVWLTDLLAFPHNVQSPEKPLLSLQHSVERENSFHGKNTRSSLLSGKIVLCQVSFLKVSSVVTVNPLELNLMPNNSSAEIPSIVDLDVPGSCFINKIDLEEQDPHHRKYIKSSNLNENEVYTLFHFLKT